MQPDRRALDRHGERRAHRYDDRDRAGAARGRDLSGQLAGDHHATARNTEHHRVLPTPALQLTGQELARLAPLMREGGYIPHTDHSCPPDISYANYVYYLKRNEEGSRRKK